ncbi:MAG: hypothetical protein Q9216_002166 [Gyalolechia sp. 2 TL-2023]
MHLPSSPISYPPSSSSPAQLAGHKRSAQPEAHSKPKKRLIQYDFPLSLRDPNWLDANFRWKDRPLPEISAQAQLKSKRQGPFVDNGDETNTNNNSNNNNNNKKETPEDGGSKCSHELQIDRNNHTKYGLPSFRPSAAVSNNEPLTRARTVSGREIRVKRKPASVRLPYGQLIAERSSTKPGKATKSFYGVEIHDLLERAAKSLTTTSQSKEIENLVQPSLVMPLPSKVTRKGRTLMWTEKYRARKFIDLVGDERTHREVLRWVKHWDPIVFPGNGGPKVKSKGPDHGTEERSPCKILLLAGPPGLGKTTLAHVCARQAGYEVVEINASDERSRDVVKGRIRDLVGTENVRGVKSKTADGAIRKAGRPVCVVVDEVDGVVGGNGGGGEGGFVKALIDLVALDQKNTDTLPQGTSGSVKRKRKGDRFRILRPMVLICNDIYHPALRPLRSPGIANIIHVRKPPMDKVVSRLRFVFENEGIPCDRDGIRRLCEATWGVSTRMEGRSSSPRTGEGDIRGLLVVGEWVAAKLRAQESAAGTNSIRLTRQWIQQHVLHDLNQHGNAARNLGRGSAKEAVERIFQENAGFAKDSMPVPRTEDLPTPSARSFGVSLAGKRNAMERIRDLVESSGECDRITTECFTAYASQPFQDDTLLSKPAVAYDWLHFHDSLSGRVFSGQEWELSPYLSQSALGFHHLFASAPKHTWNAEQFHSENEDKQEMVQFSGPRADYEALEVQKQNQAVLEAFQSSLTIQSARYLRSDKVAVIELLPYLTRILNPSVKPVIVGGSGEQKGIVSVRRKEEREMLERAVKVMGDVGVAFERSKIDMTHGGGSNYVYRMEPPIDALTSFGTASGDGWATSTTRYAIRQALDQEHQKFLASQRASADRARLGPGGITNTSTVGPKASTSAHDRGPAMGVKRDFFGRIVQEQPINDQDSQESRQEGSAKELDSSKSNKDKVFLSFHEGYSNAVRKPITLNDLMRTL